jgi:hypothetical protein
VGDVTAPETVAIDTGDVVRHEPSGERWIVAYVRDGRLAWLGWPPGEAAVFDCTLITKATPEVQASYLRALADMRDASDRRCRYARERLAASSADSSAGTSPHDKHEGKPAHDAAGWQPK